MGANMASKLKQMITKPWSRRFLWMTYVSAAYVLIAIALRLSGYPEWSDFAQVIWVGILIIPFFCPPINRWLEMDKPVPKDQW